MIRAYRRHEATTTVYRLADPSRLQAVQPLSLPSFFAAAAPHRLSVLRALWPSVTGEALANHSEVAGLQGEVLRIRADSAGWLRTVRDLKGTLLHRLRQAAGPLAPHALAFVEGPLAARPVKRRARTAPAPLSLDQLPAPIREAATRLPSDADRAVFLRAAASFEARFKRSKP